MSISSNHKPHIYKHIGMWWVKIDDAVIGNGRSPYNAYCHAAVNMQMKLVIEQMRKNRTHAI